MSRFVLWVMFVLGLPIGLNAQLPAIRPHGIVNAASFYAPGLPAGSIARGSIFTIFGSAMGPTQGVQVSAFPLQNTFSGVSITVTQGATVVNALPLYVRQDQINAIMPSNAPLGWVSVKVVYNNARSNPSPVYVVNDSVGIFTSTGTGIGPGALPPNSLANSAKPGQTVTLYATGLGPLTAPDNQAPPPGSLPTPVELWVGGIPASVSYSGRSPCCAGLDQVSFAVPAAAPQGCWVPIYIRTSHAAVSNFASLAINSKGGACSDSSNSFSSAIQSGGSFGTLSLIRMVVHEDVGVNAPVDVSNDFVTYSAQKLPASPYAFLPFYSAPPPGTCTVYPGVGDYLQTGSIPQSPPSPLDGGTQLSISGSGGQQSVTTTQNVAALGSYVPVYSFPNQLFLTPGAHTVKANGGANVGAFTASVTVPAAPTWTNRDQITTVDRSQPLTLNWSGAVTDEPVTIVAVGSDLPTNSSALAFCVVPAGASSFTVPAQVLAALPPSRINPLASKDVIYLYSVDSSPLKASGLTVGAASGGYVLGKTVTFQ